MKISPLALIALAALTACAAAALARLGLRAAPARTPEEREAFERWSPILLALPGVERWSAAERRSLARVACLKGAVDELHYVRALQAQRKLWRALCALVR